MNPNSNTRNLSRHLGNSECRFCELNKENLIFHRCFKLLFNEKLKRCSPTKNVHLNKFSTVADYSLQRVGG